MRVSRTSGTSPTSTATAIDADLALLWRASAPGWVERTVPRADLVHRAAYPSTEDAEPIIETMAADGEPFATVGIDPVTGLVFHQRFPGVDWLDRYYAEEWDDGAPATAGHDAASFLVRRANKVEALVAGTLAPGSRVLDLGCGYGDQLAHFARAGHATVGIEPSHHRAEFARTTLGLDVRNAAIEGTGGIDVLVESGAQFDLVYLNQVLEHLVDPLAVLRDAARILASGGRLLVGVPDLYYESMLLFSQSTVHMASFSADALHNVLALAGFTVRHDFHLLGYHYVLADLISAGPPVLRTPDLARIRAWALRSFGLRGRGGAPRAGEVLVVRSLHVGPIEAGYRATGRSATTPVRIATPYLEPRLWFK